MIVGVIGGLKILATLNVYRLVNKSPFYKIATQFNNANPLEKNVTFCSVAKSSKNKLDVIKSNRELTTQERIEPMIETEKDRNPCDKNMGVLVPSGRKIGRARYITGYGDSVDREFSESSEKDIDGKSSQKNSPNDSPLKKNIDKYGNNLDVNALNQKLEARDKSSFSFGRNNYQENIRTENSSQERTTYYDTNLTEAIESRKGTGKFNENGEETINNELNDLLS